MYSIVAGLVPPVYVNPKQTQVEQGGGVDDGVGVGVTLVSSEQYSIDVINPCVVDVLNTVFAFVLKSIYHPSAAGFVQFKSVYMISPILRFPLASKSS